MSITRQVPLSSPWLDERDEELVLEVLRSGRLSLGPTIDRFEEAFAEAVEAPYAAAVSSGTAGLHLLCITAGVGPGDEVITSPYSFVASANCAIYEGATPVFADIDARTLNLDPVAVEAAVTERTKAVVAVDIYGYPCELEELRAICDRHGLALVQDACEALGARYRGQLVGSHGPAAVFAFYPNKQMTTGEGGMVTTHSEDEWRLLRSLRNQGRADSGAGSTMLASVSTIGSTTSVPLSGSASSRGSTRSLGGALKSPLGIRSCSRTSTAWSCRAPTTPSTNARGSSTSSRFRVTPTAKQ